MDAAWKVQGVGLLGPVGRLRAASPGEGAGDRLDGAEGVLMMFMARPAADPGHDPMPIPTGAFVCSLWPRSLHLGAQGSERLVETQRTSWRKCHCRHWSSRREDKEQTSEEMGASITQQESSYMWSPAPCPGGCGSCSFSSASSTAPWWLRQLRIRLQCRRPGSDPWVRKIPWRREWLPTPVFLPGEFHGQWSLADYNPWGHEDSDMTERLTFSPAQLSPSWTVGTSYSKSGTE